MLFTANFTITNHSSQSLCLYSVKNLKYYFNFWFIHSVCLSVCRWYTINNLVSISNISFNSFINSVTNCGPLLLVTLSSKLCNFYILSLNNLTKPSANVSSVVTAKCAIFDNLSHTTNIISFSATNSNLVISLLLSTSIASPVLYLSSLLLSECC